MRTTKSDWVSSRRRGRRSVSLSTCKNDFITHDIYIYAVKCFKFYKSWHKLHVKIHIWCIFTVRVVLAFLSSAACVSAACLVCCRCSFNGEVRDVRYYSNYIFTLSDDQVYVECTWHIGMWSGNYRTSAKPGEREIKCPTIGTRRQQQTSGAKVANSLWVDRWKRDEQERERERVKGVHQLRCSS